MTFSRNRRRRNGKTKPREGMNPYYAGFWAGELVRQQNAHQEALLRARDEDDARRARSGLGPRDSYWQQRGAVSA